jgi:hypothetical protein
MVQSILHDPFSGLFLVGQVRSRVYSYTRRGLSDLLGSPGQGAECAVCVLKCSVTYPYSYNSFNANSAGHFGIQPSLIFGGLKSE